MYPVLKVLPIFSRNGVCCSSSLFHNRSFIYLWEWTSSVSNSEERINLPCSPALVMVPQTSSLSHGCMCGIGLHGHMLPGTTCCGFCPYNLHLSSQFTSCISQESYTLHLTGTKPSWLKAKQEFTDLYFWKFQRLQFSPSFHLLHSQECFIHLGPRHWC